MTIYLLTEIITTNNNYLAFKSLVYPLLTESFKIVLPSYISNKTNQKNQGTEQFPAQVIEIKIKLKN